MAIGITGANNGYSRPAADNRFLKLDGGTINGALNVTGTTQLDGVTSPYYALNDIGDTIETSRTSKTWTYPLSPAFTPGSEFITASTGLFFKDDGSYVYITKNDGYIYQYSISTAWDLGAVMLYASYDLSTYIPSPRGLYFSPDGLNLFITTATSLTINKFILPTAWDISSLSSTMGIPDQSVALSTLTTFGIDSVTGPYALYFNTDGTKYFLVNNKTNDYVVEVGLSDPWDITSATSATEFNITSSTLDQNVRALSFNGNGTKMFIYGNSNGAFYEFNLNSAWSIPGAELVNTAYLLNGADPAYALYYNESADKMFYFGAGDDTVHIIDNVDAKITVADLLVTDTLTPNYITVVNTSDINALGSLNIGTLTTNSSAVITGAITLNKATFSGSFSTDHTTVTFSTASAAAFRTALGGTATGISLYTASTVSDARTTLGVISRVMSSSVFATSTTPVAIPALTFPVVANKTYKIDLGFVVQSSATPGYQVTMTYPTNSRTGEGHALLIHGTNIKTMNVGATSAAINRDTAGNPNGTIGVTGYVYLRPTAIGNVTFTTSHQNAGSTLSTGPMTGSGILVTEL